ncbi:MAG: DUF4301 family protein [Tannerellaceae bacterium]|nr:DUF4301 family protein [Tannerellaceae bacterium]
MDKLTGNDRERIASRGMTEKQVEEQLACFAGGFPFPEIVASATADKGILTLDKAEQLSFIEAWDAYRTTGRKILKFVPASGAASRMFQDLYRFLEAEYKEPTTAWEQFFFDHLTQFAFYPQLNTACMDRERKPAAQLLKDKQYKTLALRLLEAPGLNFGHLPKGLIPFHAYPQGVRTALEEHLAEGALYAKNEAGEVHLHFTVSPEQEPLFHACLNERRERYEHKFSVRYHIAFSRQKPATDTVAVDMENRLLRDEDGFPIFRPGGHGALIENLNEVDADVVFIKNIDNVTPDSLKYATVVYKKILAGLLVSLQKEIHGYLRLIDAGKYTHRQVEDMIHFLHNKLCIRKDNLKHLEDAELILYLKEKLHRPLRVCGMVRNEGEPGGGPFLVAGPDGTVAPQILESSQIDRTDPHQRSLLEKGAYFNPVDLVCALKDHWGKKYHLPDYVDKNTGFISIKSKDGRKLKALELPGLWNGAMSGWNTVFVEVPSETFNPVKTVTDLLRPEHRGNP